MSGLTSELVENSNVYRWNGNFWGGGEGGLTESRPILQTASHGRYSPYFESEEPRLDANATEKRFDN